MSVLTLAEVKTHLNISTSTQDAELQTVIDSAEAAIAKLCGPLAAISKTSRVQGGTDILMLPVTPVISLTSVTPIGGTALTVSDLYVEPSNGLVTYNAWGRFGANAYTVVYSAGRSTLPSDLALAVKELVRHLWTSQRGAGRVPGQSSDDAPAPGFAIPWRVAELIRPHLQVGV